MAKRVLAVEPLETNTAYFEPTNLAKFYSILLTYLIGI